MAKINRLKTLILVIASIVLIVSVCITGYYLATKLVDESGKFSVEIERNSTKITQIAEELQQNKTLLEKEIQQLKTQNSSLNKQLREIAGKSQQNKTLLEKETQQLKTQNSNLNKQLSEIARFLSVKKPDDVEWFTNPQNGHKYALTPYAMPWQTAENYAKKYGGNLVAISNADENLFLIETFGGQVEYWTGLTDIEEEGKWSWTTGEKLVFKNWAAKEPDNFKQMQHNVILNKQIGRDEGNPAGFWNDVSGNDIHIGIIEISR